MNYMKELNKSPLAGVSNADLAVRKDHDRSLLRDRVFSNRNSRFKETTQPDSKLISVALVVLFFLGGKVFNIRAYWCSLVVLKAVSPRFLSETQTKNKNTKSKANFTDQEITASTCKRETYPNLHPKTNRKSKPNPNPKQSQSKPNFKSIYPERPREDSNL